MSFTPEIACRMYRIPHLVDYEREDGDWLLLSSGSGLMMCLMDQEPRHRYCLDTDLLTPAEWSRLPDWLTLMEGSCSRVNACGWFSNAEEESRMVGLLRQVKVPPVVYFGNWDPSQAPPTWQVAIGISDFVRLLGGRPTRAARAPKDLPTGKRARC